MDGLPTSNPSSSARCSSTKTATTASSGSTKAAGGLLRGSPKPWNGVSQDWLFCPCKHESLHIGLCSPTKKIAAVPTTFLSQFLPPLPECLSTLLSPSPPSGALLVRAPSEICAELGQALLVPGWHQCSLHRGCRKHVLWHVFDTSMGAELQ